MLRLLRTLGIDTSGYNGVELDFSLRSWGWLFLLVIACAVVIYFSVKGSSLLDIPRRRWVIVALRAIAVLLVAGIITNPALVMEKREPIKPRIALLWDESASMGLKSGTSGVSRLDEMKEFWASASSLKKKLAENYTVEIWSFSSNATQVADSNFENGPQSPPTGNATDILNALKKNAQRGKHSSTGRSALVFRWRRQCKFGRAREKAR